MDSLYKGGTFSYNPDNMDYAISYAQKVSSDVSEVQSSINSARSACPSKFSSSFSNAVSTLESEFASTTNLASLIKEMKNTIVSYMESLNVDTTLFKSGTYTLVELDTGQSGFLYIPTGYTTTAGLPLIVNLNGMAEMATPNKRTGYASVIGSGYNINAVVWIPIATADGNWTAQSKATDSEYYKSAVAASRNGKAYATIVSCEELCDRLKLDKNRISIYGNSMGAHGTYQYLEEYPNYFSTAVTWGGFIGNYANKDLVAQSGTTIIMMYGTNDTYCAQHTGRTEYDYEYIKSHGGQVVLYEVTGAIHNSGNYIFNSALVNDMINIRKGQKLDVPSTSLKVSIESLAASAIFKGNATGENTWYKPLATSTNGTIQIGNYSQEVYTTSDLKNKSVYDKANLTAEDINMIIESETKGKTSVLTGTGEAWLKASEATGLDPLFLLSLARQESGLGTSDYALKYNNFFGMKYQNGVQYFGKSNVTGQYIEKEYASSPEEGIMKAAEWIKEFYVGKYNGTTTQKFGNTGYNGGNNYGGVLSSIMGRMAETYEEETGKQLTFTKSDGTVVAVASNSEATNTATASTINYYAGSTGTAATTVSYTGSGSSTSTSSSSSSNPSTATATTQPTTETSVVETQEPTTVVEEVPVFETQEPTPVVEEIPVVETQEPTPVVEEIPVVETQEPATVVEEIPVFETQEPTPVVEEVPVFETQEPTPVVSHTQQQTTVVEPTAEIIPEPVVEPEIDDMFEPIIETEPGYDGDEIVEPVIIPDDTPEYEPIIEEPVVEPTVNVNTGNDTAKVIGGIAAAAGVVAAGVAAKNYVDKKSEKDDRDEYVEDEYYPDDSYDYKPVESNNEEDNMEDYYVKREDTIDNFNGDLNQEEV